MFCVYCRSMMWGATQMSLVVRLAGRAVCAALLACASPLGFAERADAEPATEASRVYNETVSERAARILAEYEKKREAKRREWRKANVRTYRDKNGTPVLTNRPRKYSGSVTHREVDFDPIEIEPEYQNREIESYGYEDYKELASRYAKRYGVDYYLILAVMKAESNLNPRAISTAGSQQYLRSRTECGRGDPISLTDARYV